MAHKKELVLVTGGSGFVGAHCIIQLLNRGYRVRTSIRSLRREKDVRDMLAVGNATNIEDLSFIQADLGKDESWNDAVKDCDYILHVASPFPASAPKHEDELIIPAREGTLRVLRAARDAGVKRVVLTSALACIIYGHEESQSPKVFNEEHWANPNGPGVSAYAKSKILAEKAAWDFIKEEGGSLELSAINPGAIFGPVLGPDNSTSIEVITRLMNGEMPASPRLSFPIVDVRDAADLHIRAMTDPKANGERFICSSPPSMSMKQMSLALRERLGEAAKRSPTHELPDFVVKITAWFDTALRPFLYELGKVKEVSADKAKNNLGWEPRSNVDAIVATAESLMQLKLLKH